MTRRVLLAASTAIALLSPAAAAGALSVPPPPVSPEMAAAADAFASALPVEDALRDKIAVGGPADVSSIGRRVTDQLVQLYVHHWPSGYDRTELRELFARRVSARLPALLPDVARMVRAGYSQSVRYHLSLPDLSAATEMARHPAGRSMLLYLWGRDLWDDAMITIYFASPLVPEVNALMSAAEADYREFERLRRERH